MTGTFAGALEARQIPAGDGLLSSEVTGDVVATADRVLVIRRIHIVYFLQADIDLYDLAAEVHTDYRRHCPVYRSLCKAIDITSELRFGAG